MIKLGRHWPWKIQSSHLHWGLLSVSIKTWAPLRIQFHCSNVTSLVRQFTCPRTVLSICKVIVSSCPTTVDRSLSDERLTLCLYTVNCHVKVLGLRGKIGIITLGELWQDEALRNKLKQCWSELLVCRWRHGGHVGVKNQAFLKLKPIFM